jgi:hypothetical protein
MIRATCAWVLVVLAASPVTAPFSTCDLRAFFAPTSSLQMTSMAPSASAMSAPLSIDTNANSVSPIVPRLELPDADSGGLVMLLFRGVTADDREHLRPCDFALSPDDRIIRPTVLRL